jgi:hypothetical protein
MSKHTPGPWAVMASDEEWGTYQIGAFCVDVGSMQGTADWYSSPEYFAARDEDEANARLIAAAPDLLAACEAMLSEMVVWEDEHGLHPAATAARDAIAKAKGGEA